MRLKFALEFHNTAAEPRAKRVHLITMPTPGEPGFYRSSLSADAFYGCSVRRSDMQRFSYIKHMDRYSDYHNLDLIPTSFHASIWDFYKAIGYDYKKKKFTPPKSTK